MLAEGTFDGKVALVTGGGSGLGRAFALEFARLGRRRRRRRPAAGAAGRDRRLDRRPGRDGARRSRPTFATRSRWTRSSPAAVERFGRVDVLVNNAAGNFVVKAEDLSPNGWRAVVSIVLDGGFLCSRAAGKQMIEQGDGGAILSVIASYAWTGGPGTIHSAAAKAGIVAMTRTLAVEWAPHGIRANCICPGPTDTEGAGAGALADGGGPRSGSPRRFPRAGWPRRRRSRGGRRLSARRTPATSPARRSRSTAGTGSSRTPTCPRSARRRAADP